MKVNWDTVLNVAVAIAIMAVLNKVVFSKLLEKIPSYEEMFEAA